MDTYAWVEYFKGSEEGQKVRELFDDLTNKFITMECCIAELKGWSLRENISFQEILNIFETNSEVIPVSKENWINAAVIKREMMKSIKDFGLIDAILVAKQREIKCKIITADPHFKDLNDVEFIK